MGFLVMTKTGTTPPRYIHSTLEQAATEAKILAEKFDTDVSILKIVGSVIREEIPITKKVSSLKIYGDDLPF